MTHAFLSTFLQSNVLILDVSNCDMSYFTLKEIHSSMNRRFFFSMLNKLSCTFGQFITIWLRICNTLTSELTVPLFCISVYVGLLFPGTKGPFALKRVHHLVVRCDSFPLSVLPFSQYTFFNQNILSLSSFIHVEHFICWYLFVQDICCYEFTIIWE